MPKRGSPLIAASALIGGLLFSTAGAVGAAPVTPLFTITADRAAAIPAGHRWSFNDFFPRTATIATGGTFQFTNEGFHTATLLPANWSVAADNDVNGLIAADIDDTALNPNGTIKTVENIASVLPAPQGCGTADAPCVFDGTGVVSMGAPVAGPPAPLVVTITAPPGTYNFHCRVHPWMAGSLTVVAVGTTTGVTTAASAEAAATTQATADVAAGMAAEAAASTAGQVKHANGTTTWTLAVGTSDPAGHVAVLDMLPRKVTIKKDDTVVWRPRDRNEPHTVTFANDIPADVPLCEGLGGHDTPAVPTVNPPMSPFDFACNGRAPDEFEFTGGGNAVTVITSPKTVSDSGLVAYRTQPAGLDLPRQAVLSSWSVTFAGAKAGTYKYVCQIHDGMDGTIVVR
jgi:plastocyanin